MKSIREIQNIIAKGLSKLYPIEESNAISFILLESILKIDRTALLTSQDQLINVDQEAVIEGCLMRMLKWEPIQYVTGEAFFLGRKFIVDSSVLIPRPETEELVLHAKKICRPGFRVLDIGSGSGIIGISLALEVAAKEVIGIDNSKASIEIAQRNSRLHGVKIQFHKIDFIKESLDLGKFDLVVSNPPYVLESEREVMRKNVTGFEPQEALFVSDSDPFIFYERMAQESKNILAQSGQFVVEINERFGGKVNQIFVEAGASSTSIIKDINGKDRFLSASFNS